MAPRRRARRRSARPQSRRRAASKTRGSKAFAEVYGGRAARLQLEAKDPRGSREFVDQLGEHDPRGAANTMRGVPARRPSLYDTLGSRLKALAVPTLIVAGDEDDNSLLPSLFLDARRSRPTGLLAVLPKTGHTVDLEEPDAFNRAVAETSSPSHGRALGPARPARPPRQDGYRPRETGQRRRTARAAYRFDSGAAGMARPSAAPTSVNKLPAG